jgi:hypothetical protein
MMPVRITAVPMPMPMPIAAPAGVFLGRSAVSSKLFEPSRCATWRIEFFQRIETSTACAPTSSTSCGLMSPRLIS